jgi:hypothetical protein
MAAAFRLAMAAMRGATLTAQLVALHFMSGESYLKAFENEKLQALALSSFSAFDSAMKIDLTFFGPHLILLGYLVFKSGFLPRVLGVLLMIGGAAYAIDGFAAVLLPAPGVNLAAFVGWGEILFALWLVVRGVNVEKWVERVGTNDRSRAVV